MLIPLSGEGRPTPKGKAGGGVTRKRSAGPRKPRVLVCSSRQWSRDVLVPALLRACAFDVLDSPIEDPTRLAETMNGARAQILLLDGALLDRSPVSVTQLCERIAPARLVLLVAEFGLRWIEQVLINPVSGILTVGADTQLCVQAIARVAEGELWLPRWLLGAALEELRSRKAWDRYVDAPSSPLLLALTDREREVAKLVAGGMSNKDVAETIGISIDTVKKHLKAVYLKLDVRGRAQMVLRVVEPH